MDNIKKMERKEAELEKELKELNVTDKAYKEKLDELMKVSIALTDAVLKKDSDK